MKSAAGLGEDGERMVPDFHKGDLIYAEHITRYIAAQPIVEGKIVLDIASGSGYGTQLIARHAKEVYGVDVSDDAVTYAKLHFPAANITYKVGDGEKIPLDDNSVDVVVTFETIEHIKDYKKFLAEVDRVLKLDGLLLVSTPNDPEFIEGNHFHLHEFTESELKTLLSERFQFTKSYYQTTWLATIVGEKSTYASEWTQEVELTQTARIPDEKVLYFYFICSRKPIDVEIKPISAFGRHWSARAIQKSDDMTTTHIRNIEAGLQVASKQLQDAEKLVAARQKELDQVYASKRWKLISGAANIKQKLRSGKRD